MPKSKSRKSVKHQAAPKPLVVPIQPKLPRFLNERKVAICVGINYRTAPMYALNKCVQDAENMAQFLAAKGCEIILMTDSVSTASHLIPTRSNFVTQINQLNAPQIFIHYSGHGTQVRDRNKDEADKKDEAFCFLNDAGTNLEYLIDDQLISLLKTKTGSIITVISDSCHSGTVVDLGYVYRGSRAPTRDKKGFASTNPTIISISSSLDSQVSYEYSSGGALTVSIIRLAEQGIPNITYAQIAAQISTLRNQTPVIMSSQRITGDTPFIR
jgi:hypothetical protein